MARINLGEAMKRINEFGPPKFQPHAVYVRGMNMIEVFIEDAPSVSTWTAPGIEPMVAADDGRVVGVDVHLERVDFLPPLMQWISVENRLPEVADFVLIYTEDGAVDISEVDEFDGHGVTHWMPLPEPPE